jgi:amidase
VGLHTPWAQGLIGHPHQYDIPSNLTLESLMGPNAGLTEALVPAGYVKVTRDPVFKLSEDGKRYVSAASDVPTELAEAGLPFSLVFRCEPGKEDIILKVASTYEAPSKKTTIAAAAHGFQTVRRTRERIRAGDEDLCGVPQEVSAGDSYRQ